MAPRLFQPNFFRGLKIANFVIPSSDQASFVFCITLVWKIECLVENVGVFLDEAKDLEGDFGSITICLFYAHTPHTTACLQLSMLPLLLGVP